MFLPPLTSAQGHLDKRNRNAAEILAAGLPRADKRDEARRRVKRLQMRVLLAGASLFLVCVFVGAFAQAAELLPPTFNFSLYFAALACAVLTVVAVASFRVFCNRQHRSDASHTVADPTTTFDYIFFAGDLNYRLGKPLTVEQQHKENDALPHEADSTKAGKEFVTQLLGVLDEGEPSAIAAFAQTHDQLQTQITRGAAFTGFDAGTGQLTFPPTYKTIRLKEHAADHATASRVMSVTSEASSPSGPAAGMNMDASVQRNNPIGRLCAAVARRSHRDSGEPRIITDDDSRGFIPSLPPMPPTPQRVLVAQVCHLPGSPHISRIYDLP